MGFDDSILSVFEQLLRQWWVLEGDSNRTLFNHDVRFCVARGLSDEADVGPPLCIKSAREAALDSSHCKSVRCRIRFEGVLVLEKEYLQY